MDFDHIRDINNRLTEMGYVVQERAMNSLYRCFSDTAVNFSFWLPNKFEASVVVDLLDHTVYLVDYHKYKTGKVLRWVNPDFTGEFANELFELQKDPIETSLGHKIIKTTNFNLLSALEADVSSLKEDELENPSLDVDEEEYETIELDLSDSELALIARAAHSKDMTINDFINEALRYELDKVTPDWREEYRKAYGGKCCGGC